MLADIEFWWAVSFALPLPASLIGLAWVVRRYSQCGTGGPLAVAGLVLLVLSVTVPKVVDETLMSPAFVAGRYRSEAFVARNAAMSICRLAGGLLLVAAVTSGRPPGGDHAR